VTNWLKKIQEIITKLNPSTAKPVESEHLESQSLNGSEEEGQSKLVFKGNSTVPPVESENLESQSSDGGEEGQSKLVFKTKTVKSKPLYKRYWFWISMGLGSGAIACIWGWTSLEKSIPDVSDVLNYSRQGTMTIKSSEGIIIQQLAENSYDAIKINDVPKQLLQAFVAAEDKRFYQHHGVDYQGVIRASFANINARNVVEGGSTITQQLARIVFLDQKKNWVRKLREIRIAQKIEEKFSKDKILEKYLNTVYFGARAYGIADAALVYFSKPVNQLTLTEIATLAGIVPAPSEFSPLINKEIAKQRRNLVLKRMSEQGFITKEIAEQAIASPLELQPSPPKYLTRQAHYFTDYIQTQIPKYVSKEKIDKGGLTVETTINLQWQDLGEKAIKDTVEKYGAEDNFDQAALVAIDPRTGEIKAMVGGKDFTTNQFNRVTQAQRQPGSTFKTFVYATAIAAGFSPYKSYLDAPYKVDEYEPKNFNENKYYGTVSMGDALTNSMNIVAVKVLIDVGWDTVIEMAKKMGIESSLNPTYSLALGSSEVNLLEITSGYGTLANKGEHIKAHGISKILDRQGNVIYQADLTGEKALTPETTAIMTWLLEGVVNEGTATAAKLSDRQVAGKTGTTDEARDLWFIGYIPQVVTGVWLGNDDNKPTQGASSRAASTWSNFMSKIVAEIPVEKFPPRPDKLEGRKAEIAINKINPKTAITGKIPDDDGSETQRTSRKRARDQESRENQRTVSRRERRQNNDNDNSDNQRTVSRRERRQNNDNSDNQRTVSRRERRQNNDNETNNPPRRKAPRQRNNQQENQTAPTRSTRVRVERNNNDNETPIRRSKTVNETESRPRNRSNPNNENPAPRRVNRTEAKPERVERRETPKNPVFTPPDPPASRRSNDNSGNSNVAPPAPPAQKRSE
jgi:penicillin-binding protein 1A